MNALQRLAVILGVAVVWLIAYNLNALVFAKLIHSAHSAWIFLPAALRILSVLLFDETGVAGLMLGGYLTLDHRSLSEFPNEVLVSITSAFAPLLAIRFCRRLFPIAHDLAGLRASQIVALSIAGAGANSLLLNGYLALARRLNGDVMQIIIMFIGDMLGTAIVLIGLATVLSWALPRKLKNKPR